MVRKPTETDTKAASGVSFQVLPVGSYILRSDGSKEPVEIHAVPAPTVRIRIVNRFMLNRDDHTTQIFDPKGSNCGIPGCYDVSPEDANHPYLISHSDKADKKLPQPGTLYFAEAAQKKKREETIQAMVTRQQESEAIADVRKQHLHDLRDRLGGDKSGLEDPRI